jgi:hypothetical protein
LLIPFFIAKDVLGRGILKLVEDGELFLIRGRRGSLVPSHMMYAYDLMIFCKGTLANMNILKNCFDIYAQAP